MAPRRTTRSSPPLPPLHSETSYRREPSPALSTSSYLSIEDSLPSTSSQAQLAASHLHRNHTNQSFSFESEGIDSTDSFASHSTSSTSHHTDTDSLIDASPEEVEARALEFLHMPLGPDESFDLTSNPTLPISLSSSTHPLRVQDLPRSTSANATTPGSEAHVAAVEFLRAQLAKVEESDWLYPLPAPFQQTSILDPRKVAAGMGTGAGADAWLEERFNLESYRLEGEDDGDGANGIEDYEGGHRRFEDREGTM